MKNFTHRFTLITCLMLFAGTLFAQWQVKDIGSLDVLQKVCAYNTDTIFVVGNNNALFRSNDKGITWSKVTLSTTTGNLMDIAFLDLKNGYIANSKGLILYTEDKGTTWLSLNLSGFNDGTTSVTNPNLGVSQSFSTLTCSQNTIYTALKWKESSLTSAPSHCFIYKSSDKGQNWVKLGSDLQTVNVNSIEVIGQTIYICGSSGTFRKSADGGSTWPISIANNTTYGSINDIRVIDENTVFLATAKGLFKTADGGTTISSVTSSLTTAPYLWDAMYFSDINTIFVAGSTSSGTTYIYRSLNNGSSWQSAYLGLPSSPTLMDLTNINGTIYTICNDKKLYTLTPNQLKDPVANFTTTVIGNEATTSNKSENCGSYVWNFGDGSKDSSAVNITHPYNTYNTYDVKLISKNAITNDTLVQKITIAPPSASFSFAYDAIDKNKVAFTNTSANCKSYSWDFKTGATSTDANPTFIFSKLGTYEVTLSAYNGIETVTAKNTITIDTIAAPWSYLSLGVNQILHKMYAFNNDTAIIAGNGTTILRTNDGGNTWTPAIYPAANAGFLANDIIFFSKEIGLISFSFSGSNNGFILKTTDNGQNWSPIDLAVFSDASNDAALDPKAATAKSVSIFAMAKTSSTTGFATLRWQDAANAYHGYIYKTTDQGSTWAKVSVDIFKDYSFSSFITCMAFDATGATGYVGGNKYLLKTVDGGNTWTNISKAEYGYINDMVVKDANNVFIATGIGTMKTTDGFNTFSILTSDYSFDVIALNESTYLTGKDLNTTKLTKDNGTTWEASGKGIGSAYYELAIFNNKVYALSGAGKAYISYLDFYFKPVLDFTYTKGDKTVTFSNSSVNTKNYSWTFGDNQTSAEVSPIHVYADYGNYTVTLNGSNLCWKATPKTVTISITTGVEEVKMNSFSIWPNPTTGGNVNLSLGEAFNNDATINIFDIQGRLVSTQKLGSNRQISIELNSGMYIVKVFNSKASATQKLIVK